MKKLYNCSARYDSEHLVSYSTLLYQCKNRKHFLYVYRSNTSMSHIRKFIKKLREDGFHDRANDVEMMYRLCIDTKKSCACCDNETGEILLGTYEQCEERFLEK